MRYRKLSKQTKVAGRRVLVRVSANVPLVKGKVGKNGALRLEKLVPTITHLVRKKAKVIIVTHVGRPGGRRVKKFSAAQVAKPLSKILQKQIRFIPHTFGKEVEQAIATMKGGEILFLENIR